MNRIIAAKTLVALAIQAVLFVAHPNAAFAGSSCSACKGYWNDAVDKKSGNRLSKQGVVSHCGPIPLTGAPDSDYRVAEKSILTSTQQGMDPNFRTCKYKPGGTEPDGECPAKNRVWDECYAKWQAEWATLGQYCETQGRLEDAHKWNKISAIVYTGAAVACGISCYMSATAVGNVYSLQNDIACMLGNAAVVGDFIAERVMLGDEQNKKLQRWTDSVGLGAVSGTVATMMITSAASSTNVAAAKAYNCVGMVLLGGAASAKWIGMKKYKDSSDKNCKSATELAASPLPTYSGSPGNGGGSGNPDGTKSGGGSATGGGTIAGGGGGSSGTTGGAISEDERNVLNNPNSPQYAAAIAGPIAPLLARLSPDRTKELLGRAGASMEDIARRLSNGESPAQVAASGLPSGFGEAMASVDKTVKDGKYPEIFGGSAGGGATFATGGGGGGAGGKSTARPAFPMFGSLGGSPMGGAPTETAFDKARRELAAIGASGDIWHEGFGGTIFQIISDRLDHARDRIDQVEWDTPLNRALMGLPSRKPGARR